MTQETMTKEQILEILNNVYRNHMTPGIATGIIQQQLSAERERYDQLKAKYDVLVMDNATLEYNAAEAQKHLPDVIKQFVDKEQERAGKLVHALKMCVDVLKGLDATDYVAYTAGKVALIEYKQTITEYDPQK